MILELVEANRPLRPERMRAITVFRDRSGSCWTGREDSEWENPARRWIQSMDERARLEKRREKGLPTPTDYNQHQAATKIQAPCGLSGKTITSHDHRKSLSSSRPESVATWFDSGRLRCSGPFNIVICAQIWVEEFLCDREWGLIETQLSTRNLFDRKNSHFEFDAVRNLPGKWDAKELWRTLFFWQIQCWGSAMRNSNLSLDSGSA